MSKAKGAKLWPRRACTLMAGLTHGSTLYAQVTSHRSTRLPGWPSWYERPSLVVLAPVRARTCGPVLAAAGFTFSRTDNKGYSHWARPGKDPRDGTSATVYPGLTITARSGARLSPASRSAVRTACTSWPVPLAWRSPLEKVPCGAGKPAHLVLVPASSVRMKRQLWFWRSRVPLGGATISSWARRASGSPPLPLTWRPGRP